MKRHNEAIGEVVWVDEMKMCIKREITNIKQNWKSNAIHLIFFIFTMLLQYNAFQCQQQRKWRFTLLDPPAFNSCNKLEYCKKNKKQKQICP